MTVFDVIGRAFHFDPGHTPVMTAVGGLEVRDPDGGLVGSWSASGWVGVVEDGACQEVE